MPKSLNVLFFYILCSCHSFAQIDSNLIDFNWVNLNQIINKHNLLNKEAIDSLNIGSFTVSSYAYKDLNQDSSSTDVVILSIQKPLAIAENNLIAHFDEVGRIKNIEYCQMDSCCAQINYYYPIHGNGFTACSIPFSCENWSFEPADSSWTVQKKSKHRIKETSFRKNYKGKALKTNVKITRLNYKNQVKKVLFKSRNISRKTLKMRQVKRRSVTRIRHPSDSLRISTTRFPRAIFETYYTANNRISKEIYYDNRKKTSGQINIYQYTDQTIQKSVSNFSRNKTELKEVILSEFQNSIINRVIVCRDNIKYVHEFKYEYF